MDDIFLMVVIRGYLTKINYHNYDKLEHMYHIYYLPGGGLYGTHPDYCPSMTDDNLMLSPYCNITHVTHIMIR